MTEDTTPAPVPDEALPGEPHMELLEMAWGVIANAGWDGSAKTTGWQEAAERWRDDYHRWLDLHLRPGGYQTWEELALSVTRERDALAAEITALRTTAGGPLILPPDEFEAVKAVAALCPRCLHDGVLERTLERAVAAEAKLAEYENAISWHTSCTSCARVLDSAYAETVRREQAEAKLARIAGICRESNSVRAAERILAIIGSEKG